MMTTAPQLKIVTSDPVPDGWITAAAAAAIFGKSTRAVQIQCAAGALVSKNIGGKWYVDPACSPALRLAAGYDTPVAVAGTELAGLTAVQRERAMARMKAVQDFEAAMENKPATMSLRDFLCHWVQTRRAVHGGKISVTQMFAWRAAWKEKGIAGLVDRRGGHREVAPFSPECKEFILGAFLRDSEPRLKTIYALAVVESRQQGWQIPSLRTVQAWMQKRVDPKLKLAGRDPVAFKNRAVPHVERDWTHVAAMECWVADHRQFDVMVPRSVWNEKKKKFDTKFYRPWVTMFLDCRSWMPVAWIIDFDSPNGDRVMATFSRGVEAHGAPEHLILDNGKDFRKREFAGGRIRKVPKGEQYLDKQRTGSMLGAMGITPHWAIPYNAKAKIVENFFRIMSEQFDKTFHTYCGRTPKHRPEGLKNLRAKEMTGFDLPAFRSAFERWITLDYSLREHSSASRGLSAARAFVELRRSGHQPVRPAVETLALLTSRSSRRPVRQNGVWCAEFMAHYWADELESRRAASSNDIARHVVYRYRPDEPHRIFVFDARTDQFICIATPYAGSGVHPLASIGSDEDRERLDEALALQRQATRDYNGQARELRKTATTTLLEAQRQAGEHLRLLDDPRTIARPTPVLKLVGSGEMDRAAQAGVKHEEKREANRRAKELFESDRECLAATGTDSDQPAWTHRTPDPLGELADGQSEEPCGITPEF